MAKRGIIRKTERRSKPLSSKAGITRDGGRTLSKGGKIYKCGGKIKG